MSQTPAIRTVDQLVRELNKLRRAGHGKKPVVVTGLYGSTTTDLAVATAKKGRVVEAILIITDLCTG